MIEPARRPSEILVWGLLYVTTSVFHLFLFVSGHLEPASHCVQPCDVCYSQPLCFSPSVHVCSQIREQLKEEEINIYQFPDCDSDEDEDFKRQDAEMKVQRRRRKGQRSRGGGCGGGG